MLRNLNLPIALLLATNSLVPLQSRSVDITKTTRWRDTAEVKIVEGTLRFKEETHLGDGVRECAKVIIDMTFQNQGSKPILQTVFQIVLHGNKAQSRSDSKLRISKSEEFLYDHVIPPAGTGSLLYELSGCDVLRPVRQTVRVVRIIYEDGSALKLNSAQRSNAYTPRVVGKPVNEIQL